MNKSDGNDWIGKTVMSKEGHQIGKTKDLLKDDQKKHFSVLIDTSETLEKTNEDFLCPIDDLSEVRDILILEEKLE